MISNESKKLARLVVLLRIYGVITLVIFGSLLFGFAIQTPLLADEPKGALNWTIWNGIRWRPRALSCATHVVHHPYCVGCVLLSGRSQPVGIRILP